MRYIAVRVTSERVTTRSIGLKSRRFLACRDAGTLRATTLCMSDINESRHPSSFDASFDANEEHWFSERPTRRPSQRPTSPAPAFDSPPALDDSIADGWFRDA